MSNQWRDMKYIAAMAKMHERRLEIMERNSSKPNFLVRMIQPAFASNDDIDRQAEEELGRAKTLTQAELRAMQAEVEGNFFSYFIMVLYRLDKTLALHVLSLYYAMTDPETDIAAKAAIVVVLIYFINPFDLIPDIILGLGFVDDGGVVLAAINAIGRSIKEAHRKAARIHLDRL